MTTMTVKDLYEWAVKHGYEDLPLVTDHLGEYGECDGDGFITPDSIELRIDSYDEDRGDIKGLFLSTNQSDYCFD